MLGCTAKQFCQAVSCNQFGALLLLPALSSPDSTRLLRSVRRDSPAILDADISDVDGGSGSGGEEAETVGNSPKLGKQAVGVSAHHFLLHIVVLVIVKLLTLAL
jgi:hypothetical protein